MQEPTKFCFACGQQNNLSAAFCQKCGLRYEKVSEPQPAPKEKSKPKNAQAFAIVGVVIVACWFVGSVYIAVSPKRQDPSDAYKATTPTPYSDSAASAPVASAERMVLDDAHVTAYVECTHREWKKYKIHFIVKKPGSPLLTPILRQAGNPRAYAVVVNGVDTGDDFAFSPNIAAFDSSGQIIDATFVSRPLNGNVALGYAYHDLIVKYERGN